MWWTFLTFSQRHTLKQELEIDDLCLFVIDEISTCSTEVLAIVDLTLCLIGPHPTKPFRGIPVLLVKDFTKIFTVILFY